MTPPYRTFLVLGMLACLVGCSDNNENNVVNNPTVDASVDVAKDSVEDTVEDTQADESSESTTAGVLCDVNGDGMQQLVYTQFDPRTGDLTDIDETLAYTFAWSCPGDERVLSGNGVPNHAVTGGEFASKVSAQDISMTVTLNPAVAGSVTQVKEPGYALNSIKFDPATAGTCPDDAVVDTECDYGAGSDTWRMVATGGDVSPWKFGFGVDENDAHVQPTGQYHYHGNPANLAKQLNSDFASSMTLVGWATDGFPIYSIYGLSDVDDAASSVVKMTSSWRTVAVPAANRPSVDDFPLGHFEQDWEYVEGSGDLDQCNGRVSVTPEFPNGIYHYYTTETYPFVQRCVSGTSAEGGGPPGGGPPGGM